MKQNLTEYQLATQTLKLALKRQKLTYKDLAGSLKMSESGVKKVLTARDGSFQRLAQICRLLGLTLSEALESANESIRSVSYSTKQQEYLLSEPRAFRLYWALTYERQELGGAERAAGVSSKESFSFLRRLDQLKLLELLPGGKVRVPAVRQIRWVGEGPLVEKLYRDWSVKLVRSAPIEGDDSMFMIRYFKLSPRTYRDLIAAYKNLETEFVRRATQDMRSEAPDLQHLQWLTVIDKKSFLANGTAAT